MPLLRPFLEAPSFEQDNFWLTYICIRIAKLKYDFRVMKLVSNKVPKILHPMVVDHPFVLCTYRY